MNKLIRKTSSIALAIIMSCILSTGCGRTETPPATPVAQTEISVTAETSVSQAEISVESAETSAAQQETTAAETATSETQDAASTEPASTPAPQAEVTIAEDGSYNSKEDVALYLHVYGKLPGNYITKKKAKKLGWHGGSLEDYAPGMCIGGDRFGNNEGLLPEDADYHECDIDTLGKEKRGAKRIIYSDDGYIYYTEDHYQSFEQLYGPDN